jgi:hypothetical protein
MKETKLASDPLVYPITLMTNLLSSYINYIVHAVRLRAPKCHSQATSGDKSSLPPALLAGLPRLAEYFHYLSSILSRGIRIVPQLRRAQDYLPVTFGFFGRFTLVALVTFLCRSTGTSLTEVCGS